MTDADYADLSLEELQAHQAWMAAQFEQPQRSDRG
jgi:hypothetical protein